MPEMDGTPVSRWIASPTGRMVLWGLVAGYAFAAAWDALMEEWRDA
jgi:hypothetical protein